MKTRTLLPFLAALALLCACKGKGNSEYELTNNSKAADITTADTTVAAPKLVKISDMRLKVKNVQQTSEHIATLTSSLNGMVMHHQMSSSVERSEDIRISDDSVKRVSSFSTTAEMTLKIPSEKLDDFMNQVAHMGIYVTNRSMDITDKSLDYLSARLKLKSRAELVDQQQKGKVVIKDPAKVLNLKDDMIDQQISNKGIDDAVKNSVVTLSFYESNTIRYEIIANDDPSNYRNPFFTRLGMAFENGWEIFKAGVVGIADLWVLILIGVIVWRVYVYNKNRKAVELSKV